MALLAVTSELPPPRSAIRSMLAPVGPTSSAWMSLAEVCDRLAKVTVTFATLPVRPDTATPEG